jgi:hypothetical protein
VPPCSAVQAAVSRVINSTNKCFRAAIGQIYRRWKHAQSAVRR